MVASLRGGSHQGYREVHRRFPPSKDGGFIEGSKSYSIVLLMYAFPPSKDGGFIEGYELHYSELTRYTVSTIERWWLH